MIVTMPLGELIEDLSLYPRSQVSDIHVASIVETIQAGMPLPPLIADEESKRMVDGWHRRRAYIKVLGLDANIDVDLRRYDSEAELLLAAVAAQGDHGLRLTAYEQRKSAQNLQDMGVGVDEIGVALRCTPGKVNKLQLQFTTVERENAEPLKLALKRSLMHFQGRQMTEPQARQVLSAPGVDYGKAIRDVRVAMEFDLLPQSGKVFSDVSALIDAAQNWRLRNATSQGEATA